MKNEEIIEILKGKLEYYNSSLAEYYDEELINVLEEANKKIKENAKLKAEIEQLKLYATNIINAKNLSEETAVSIRMKMQREILLAREIELLKEMYEKSKAEIERLNGKSEMYRDMADSFCNSNIKLKAEIEQLKNENIGVSQQNTERGYEIGKLKSELKKYKKEIPQTEVGAAYDLGYQACLNDNGVNWKDAEEIQKLRKEIEQLKGKVES